MKGVYVFIDMYLEHMDAIFGICNVLERPGPCCAIWASLLTGERGYRIGCWEGTLHGML